MGLILFIVAIILTSAVTLISLVFTPIYYISTFKWKSGVKELDKWFYKLALSVDQFGNVSCGKTLQVLLTKPVNFPFGDEDDTVSYVLAKNRELNALTLLGRITSNILDTLDKDHLSKALESKKQRDIEACKRISDAT